MRVFRVVNSAGEGVYRDRKIVNILYDATMLRDWEHEYTPGPIDDGLYHMEQSGWLFGFRGINWMKRWFPLRHRNCLSFLGCKVLEVECDEVVEGGCQVVFNPESAYVVASYSVNHFDTKEDREKLFYDREEDFREVLDFYEICGTIRYKSTLTIE